LPIALGGIDWGPGQAQTKKSTDLGTARISDGSPSGEDALSGERVERRLAAILAADVAGYSRLMGKDEEGTHERLKAHLSQLINPKINEYRGRVVKNTGDGMLAEFSSVVDAVRCAAEMQRGMADRNAGTLEDKRVTFRIGINLGDVIVEPDDIYGDGVNIAARLEALAEPGGICISDDAFHHVQGKVDAEFIDIGEQELKNIARPIRAYRAVLDKSASASSTAMPLPDKPSIAVLPFANVSSDPEQEFFADGIAEDVITALSRYPSLFVIARNSCFTYKAPAVKVRQVGRELGVRYVLEGSLRRSGNRVRITAQLVEAENGNYVWAERYDRDLADIFAVQDDITEAVTTAVAPTIADAERQRAMRKPPDSLDAWAAYQRGLWHMCSFSVEENAGAQRCFQEAIDLDPNFAGAYWGLAWAQLHEAAGLQRRDLAEAQKYAEALARRAVALGASDAEARSALAFTLLMRGDYDAALTEAERAIALSPNLAVAHGERGATLIYSGQSRDGVEAIRRCIRLDPHDPLLRVRLLHLTTGLYFAGEFRAATESAKQAIGSFPEFPSPYGWLAAALGQLGRSAEAKEALQKAIMIAPQSFNMYVRNRVPWMRPEDHAHMLDGLQKAGWEG
jgi:adenylate cyclase